MNAPIRIEMLGGLRVRLNYLSPTEDSRVISHFTTYKTSALLAYMAYHYKQPLHPRETLAEMFWPDATPEGGRASLRAALASLRRQLEPPEVAAGTILIATRFGVQLNPDVIITDVREWEAACKAVAQATRKSTDTDTLLPNLRAADALYSGDLLPGFYEEWTLAERERLSEAHRSILRELARLSEKAGDLTGTIEVVRRLINSDPFDEDTQHLLMRLQSQYSQQSLVAGRDAVLLPSLSPTQSVNNISSPLRIPDVPLTPASCLPLTLTRFFGRETEIAYLLRWFSPNESEITPRLVTLTGPGGGGKTRIALEAARRLSAQTASRIVFVPLVDVSHPKRILNAVADAARSTSAQTAVDEGDPLEQISLMLDRQPALLILDNFEHLLVDDGVLAIQILLARLPEMRCLVTSRLLLDIEGEQELSVLPLTSPSSTDAPEHLLKFPAVQLFLDRAQAVRPDFQITSANAALLASLCAQLEGIPLSLELAASWAQMLTPSQMLARLDQRLNFLVSRRRPAHPRHQSLRAVLDNSYHLLPPAVQRFFAALSIFRGGWTLASAESVCDTPEALAFLTQLRLHSLITVEEDSDEMRYRMLETVREYAEEQLDAETNAALRVRHTAYFVTLAQAAEPELRGGLTLSRWLTRLETEQENMRLVLARAESDPESSLRLAGTLGRFWYLRGHWSEGRAWLRQLLERDHTSLSARARALLAAATLAWTQDMYAEARQLCTEGLNAFQAQQEKWGIASSLSLLGMLSLIQGDPGGARPLLEESLALFQEIGDRWSIAQTLDRLSYAVRDMGDYTQAATLDRQCLALRRDLGDQHGVAVSISNLADMAFLQGDLDEAGQRHAESLEGFRALQEMNGIGYALSKLGMVSLRQGKVAQAEEMARESLALFWKLRDRRRMAYCLETFAGIRHAQRQSLEAVRLLGAASALRDSISAPLTDDEKADWERSVAATRDTLDLARFTKAWTQGQELSLEQVVALVL